MRARPGAFVTGRRIRETYWVSAVRPVLKRGMLVAVANWQVTVIQSAADSIFKLLVAVPAVGGAVFMALMIGAEPEGLLSLDWRDLIATVLATLLSQPLVLVAFGLSLAVVIAGGSLFMFLVKGGTIAALVSAEHQPPHATSPEDAQSPLAQVAAVAAFTVDGFFSDCASYFLRYTRLGLILVGVYVVSAAVFLSAGVALAGTGGMATSASLSLLFVAWVTLVNLVYLLVQIIIVAEDCHVHDAIRRVAGLARSDWRAIGAIFLVVLVVVALGTVVSIVAMGALSLISFVPLIGLAVLPVQLVAWLFRALVFQFIDLGAVGAYANRFRASRAVAANGERVGLSAREPADVQGAS